VAILAADLDRLPCDGSTRKQDRRRARHHIDRPEGPRTSTIFRRRSGGAVHRPIARHDRAARPVGPCPISAFFPNPAKQLAESTSGIPRMTPKRTQRFSGLLQDWREVWMATSSSGSPDDGRGADLAIFTGIWTHSSCRLLLNA